MTPAIKTAEQAKINYNLHEYKHDDSAESYGSEAAEKLGLQAERVFKTLVVELSDKKLAVGVVPVSAKLNMKGMAKACGSKKAMMADKQRVTRTTGYVLGGVSPLGQKKRLRTLVDESAAGFGTIFISAGRRGLEIELDPRDLVRLVDGAYAEICD